jgi:hypothetical protein
VSFVSSGLNESLYKSDANIRIFSFDYDFSSRRKFDAASILKKIEYFNGEINIKNKLLSRNTLNFIVSLNKPSADLPKSRETILEYLNFNQNEHLKVLSNEN